jgi:hypothetical protein
MTDTEINKKICELLGICWHEVIEIKQRKRTEGGKIYYDERYECKKCGERHPRNPDFTANAAVLPKQLQDKVSAKEYSQFIEHLLISIGVLAFIDKYILNPRLLCEAYIKWRGNEKICTNSVD